MENIGTNDMHHGFISRYSEPTYKVVARNTRSIEGARRWMVEYARGILTSTTTPEKVIGSSTYFINMQLPTSYFDMTAILKYPNQPFKS